MKYISEIAGIAGIISLIAVIIAAFYGNIPFVIMNGFLLIINILFIIDKNKNEK